MDRLCPNRPKPGVGNYQHYAMALFAGPPCGSLLHGELLGDHLILDEVLEDRGRGVGSSFSFLGRGRIEPSSRFAALARMRSWVSVSLGMVSSFFLRQPNAAAWTLTRPPTGWSESTV
jgi:hypothetical protein